MKIRADEHFADIPSIKTQQGEITTDPKRINDAFQSFYSELYRSEITFDKTKYEAFLNELELPCLTEDDSKQLAEAKDLGGT